MRLSRKGRFAVTAMMNLALNADKGPMTLTELTHDQGISLSYLEQIFARLRKENLVAGVRGPGGGYRLSRAAKEICVADVITAVDEKVDARKCEGKGNCNGESPCLTHDLWCDLSDQIYSFLQSIDLEQLVTQENSKARTCSSHLKESGHLSAVAS